MIKAIAFDLWETLITDTPVLSRRQERLRLSRMEQILGALGADGLAAQLERAYRATWHRCQDLYWSVDRDVPCRRQIEHFLEEVGLDPGGIDEVSLAALEHAYANAAVEILPGVVDGAAEVLAEIKASGLGVGLISNTGRTPGYALRQILDDLGLSGWIDVMVFSNEHGECKPRPSIFEKLRSGLAVEYPEVVFVGDNPWVDVYGAQRCGMPAVLFEPPVRGTAVAPPVEHGMEIVPDARITTLRELMPAVRGLGA